MNGERWTLTNDPPRVIRQQTEGALPMTRQRALFCGLDCLPGQRDLFLTDGEAERDAGPFGATTLGVGDHGGN